MTVEISEPGIDKKPGNRRTLSESDVRFGQGQVSQTRIEFAPNISSMTGVFSQFFLKSNARKKQISSEGRNLPPYLIFIWCNALYGQSQSE